jgi:hypothetical protein
MYKFFKNIDGISIFEYLFLLKNLVLFLNQYSNTNFFKKFNINNTPNCLLKILPNLMYLQINGNKLSILPRVYKIKSPYKTHNTIKFNIQFSENKFLSNSTTTNLKLKYKNLSKFFIHSNNYAHTSFFYYNWVLGFVKNYIPKKNNFFVKYTNTNVVKFINTLSLNSFDIFFLRKSKIFNKGRYSRNRQFYRTGVYWCLYLSIILFTGLYY